MASLFRQHLKSSISLQGFIAFAVILAVLPGLTRIGVPSFLMTTLIFMFLYAALSQCYNIIGGYSGYVHFGLAAFFGIGAYTTAIILTNYGWSAFATSFIGGGLSALFAFVIGRPTLRLKGPYFPIATLAIGVVIQLFVLSERWLTQAGRGIPNVHEPLIPTALYTQGFYWIFLGLTIITTLVAWKVEHSKLGYGLMAIRENEDAAEVLGVDVASLKVRAFVISSVLASIAGSFWATYLTWINPDSIFSLDISLFPILMTVLGGSGAFLGPIIGAFVMEISREYLVLYAFPGSSVHLLVFGLIMLVIMLVKPSGIIGIIKGFTRTKRNA